MNDLTNWQELQSFFKAFHSRCVMFGITGNKVMLSPGRKTNSSGRYNWTDTVPMIGTSIPQKLLVDTFTKSRKTYNCGMMKIGRIGRFSR